MSQSKQVRKIISNSIRKETQPIDEMELRCMFNQMTDEFLKDFWFRFRSNNIFQGTEPNIPSNAYKREYFNEKTFTRTDFENYVLENIVAYITERIEARKEFRSRSILERLHPYMGIAVVACLPAFIICSIVEYNNHGGVFCHYTIGLIFLIFSLYTVLSIILSFLAKRKGKS